MGRKRIKGVKKGNRRGTQIQSSSGSVLTPQEVRDYHLQRRKELGLPQDFRDIELRRTEKEKVLRVDIPETVAEKIRKLKELIG